MKRRIYHIILLTLGILIFLSAQSRVKANSEVIKIDGIWRMVIDGVVDYNYTGIGQNANGYWYLEDGTLEGYTKSLNYVDSENQLWIVPKF